MDIEAVEKLITDLSKPIFLFRMSGEGNPRANSLTHENARIEVDRIVTEYVKAKEPPAAPAAPADKKLGRKLRKARRSA